MGSKLVVAKVGEAAATTAWFFVASGVGNVRGDSVDAFVEEGSNVVGTAFFRCGGVSGDEERGWCKGSVVFSSILMSCSIFSLED